MTGRQGFSLVEMVIVLVLAGIVSTAAITMFSTQNELNAQMTALGESQENARSAVSMVASEMRAATGGVVRAEPRLVVMRLPVALGVICSTLGNATHVYFPGAAGTIDLARDVDGWMLRRPDGYWHLPRPLDSQDGFAQSSRVHCASEGLGSAGTDGDYARLRGRETVGLVVMLYQEIRYTFAPSALDSSSIGFHRLRGGASIELASGFTSGSRFEYQIAGDTTWYASVTTNVALVDAIRMRAEARGTNEPTREGGATFSLVRDIPLRNAP